MTEPVAVESDDSGTAMSEAEPPRLRGWYAPLFAGDLAALWPAIVIAFLGVLAIAFAMSYHGLFVFGERIMGWMLGLCITAPIGVDVFSLVGLLATFLTRDATWRVRLYCWLAFLSTVALSVAGNAISAYALLDLDAARRGAGFEWGYRQVSAIVGAAFWPALSAIALHVLIVVRRHLDGRRDSARLAAETARAAEDGEKLLQADAIVLAAAGATAVDIRKKLGLGEERQRTVERWTETIRAALAAPRPAVVAAKATSTRTTTAKVRNTTTE